MREIRVHDTREDALVPLETVHPNEVRMYVCGPTVYSSTHLGHARHAVVWDAFRRALEHLGRRVLFAMNITDIDDKIIKRAHEEGVSTGEIAARYTREYFEDLRALNCRPADVHPRATEEIGGMIELVRLLVERGHAYVLKGEGVYFSVESFPGYGKLSGRDLEDEPFARIEPNPKKKHPADFALWKSSKEGEPCWDSLWGKGRPGWHIECSAMSARYLGLPFDIHAGGRDLIFPHHENELAQTECGYGKEFARYWMHNGFITVGAEKMSKSLGNVFNLREALKARTGAALRFFFLGTHYRHPIDFVPERLDEAENALERIKNCLGRAREAFAGPGVAEEEEFPKLDEDADRAREAFSSALADDFNAPLARAQVFELVSAINTALDGVPNPGREGRRGLASAVAAVEEMLGVLGVRLEEARAAGGGGEELLQLLITLRKEARARKDFQLADRVRSGLREAGVELEDLPGGDVRAKKIRK